MASRLEYIATAHELAQWEGSRWREGALTHGRKSNDELVSQAHVAWRFARNKARAIVVAAVPCTRCKHVVEDEAFKYCMACRARAREERQGKGT